MTPLSDDCAMVRMALERAFQPSDAEARLIAKDALARLVIVALYGEGKLREEYAVEASVEALLSTLHRLASQHRSFEVFKAECLDAFKARIGA